MKKIYLVGLVVILFIAGILFLRVLNGGEDNWIKDSRGIFVKHGNPADMPSEVDEQKKAVACAQGLYEKAKDENMQFNSQCLGSCGSYAVDIVHVPRNSADNENDNQCKDYPEITPNFIELNNLGEIVRVVD